MSGVETQPNTLPAPPETAVPTLTVDNLSVSFSTQHGVVAAVENVSFSVAPGKTVAVVGESGSGKSVTAQAILGIFPRNARMTSGALRFCNEQEAPVDLHTLDPMGAGYRDLRGD